MSSAISAAGGSERSPANAYGSIHAVLPLLDALRARGLAPEPILERAGIPASALSDPRARFPQRAFGALWLAASEATGDPAIALRVAVSVKPTTLGVIGYLASASASGRNAFELVRDLTPILWEDVGCDLESHGDAVFIRCRTGVSPRPHLFTIEYAIGLAVAMSRFLGAGRFEAIEASFSHAAPTATYAEECQQILGLPVRFAAAEDGVLLPGAMLDASNPFADAELRRLLERHAAEQLAGIQTRARLVARARACVRSMLPEGDLSADCVAARLGMSSRTLRRRLREEETTYQEILDDVRSELARRYLADERRGIGEVAFLLGFSDASAFTKAFRRWSGRTPADFVRAPSS